MNFFKKQFNIIKVGFKDIRNFSLFKKDILLEINNSKSLFHDYNLHINKLKNIIYTDVNIPDDYEQNATDKMKLDYLIDLIKPINQYFQQQLLWGEYLTYKFYHYENNDDPSELIKTYHVEWEFTPYECYNFRFWRNLIILFLFFISAIKIITMFI